VSGPVDRKTELLADRALDGLSEAEARELDRLGGSADDGLGESERCRILSGGGDWTAPSFAVDVDVDVGGAGVFGNLKKCRILSGVSRGVPAAPGLPRT